MTAPTLLDLSGTQLTLFGLLISLFAIHLGTWLARLQSLRTRWDINRGDGPAEYAVRRECRYVFVELYNWQPFVMTLILMLFGGGVLVFFNTLQLSSAIALPWGFVLLFNGFFALMIVLQLVLLVSGYLVGRDLKAQISSAFIELKDPAILKTFRAEGFAATDDKAYNILRDTAKVLDLDLSKFKG